jgi:hypothetical protein
MSRQDTVSGGVVLDSHACVAAAKALCNHSPFFVDGFSNATSLYSDEARKEWCDKAIKAASVVVSAYLAALKTAGGEE